MHLAATSVERRGIMGCVRNGYISIFAVVLQQIVLFFFILNVFNRRKKKKAHRICTQRKA